MLDDDDKVDKQLVECFSLIFPGLGPAEIKAMSVETAEAWDSLASLSLVTVIEEEFDIVLPDAQIAQMTSFAAARDALRRPQ